MGYDVGNLIRLGHIIYTSGLTGRRLMDLGSQDVTVVDASDLQSLVRFVAHFGGDAVRLGSVCTGPFPMVITARDVFAAAGFDYVCCDVDRRPGTVYVDFNTLTFDRALYGSFDLVMNAGTTEHLSNPVAAFFLMHHLCRKGGIVFNEVPLSGWLNHGLNNLTPKFWHTMKWMNAYEALFAQVKYIDGARLDVGNFGGDHLNFIKDLSEAGRVSSTIEIIFRKTEDRGFVPPFDAVVPTGDGGEAVAQLVHGSLRPFIACGALTDQEGVDTVNAFLAFQGLSYRMTRQGKHRLSPFHRLALLGARCLPKSVR